MVFGLGGVRDTPDNRDYAYVPPSDILANLPKSINLTNWLPPVYNQGQVNSCTANAIAAAVVFDEIKAGARNVPNPSRLFIYYNERAMEGKADQEVGGQLRDGIKSVSKQGVCAESMWPYLKANVLVKPPKTCYSRAQKFSFEYQRMMHNLDHFRACLASGYPFVFGIKVFSSFQGNAVKKTGRVNMPYKGEKSIGLHAVLAAGYDDKSHRFLVRNSWGKSWGQHGYFTMPYGYLLDSKISHDFWTVRFVKPASSQSRPTARASLR